MLDDSFQNPQLRRTVVCHPTHRQGCQLRTCVQSIWHPHQGQPTQVLKKSPPTLWWNFFFHEGLTQRGFSPFCYWDHLLVGLVPDDVINEVKLCRWPGEGRGKKQLRSEIKGLVNILGFLGVWTSETERMSWEMTKKKNPYSFISSGSLKRGGSKPGRKSPL